MTIRKETELVKAIIVYCQRCQEEGDIPALREMGFGPREVNALQSLTTSDALRLASTRSHFLTIRIDTEIYWRMIDYMNREQAKRRLIEDMIRKEAPLPMMHALTGMGSKEFVLQRRKCGMGNSPPGRPAIPTPEVVDKVWTALQNSLMKNKVLGPEEFMEIYEDLESEVPLRVIWFLTRQWDRDGTLKAQAQLEN